MPWRPYVVSKKWGTPVAMRGTKLYDTKDAAIKAMKRQNKDWVTLNYSKDMSKFEYGAIDVGNKKYKYKKGKEGNKQVLKYHYSQI
ncbi:MAG: hypothetical protein NWE83_07325 [Candidatus Bathyarchaeota archaeon]|jgi:hypothetical protein|nr:hypothetical protein [Candidatus Bathyarchaeota archaeon]